MKATRSRVLMSAVTGGRARCFFGAAILLASICSAGGEGLLGAPRDAETGGCKGKAVHVSGSISANVVTNAAVSTGLALGTVTGSLAGATLATFAATPDANGNLKLVLHHNFVTNGRNTLATQDTGTLIPVPGVNNVFRMSVDYTIIGGTGEFASATGTLHNHGEADLNTGLLTLSYSGQVCRAE
jgi:hypothetical protein